MNEERGFSYRIFYIRKLVLFCFVLGGLGFDCLVVFKFCRLKILYLFYSWMTYVFLFCGLVLGVGGGERGGIFFFSVN